MHDDDDDDDDRHKKEKEAAATFPLFGFPESGGTRDGCYFPDHSVALKPTPHPLTNLSFPLTAKHLIQRSPS